MCEALWNIWLCQMNVCLRSHDAMRAVSFFSLFFPQGQFSIEGMIGLSHVSMDTLIDSTQPFWHLCAVCLHVSFVSPSNFPLALWFFLATSSTQLEDLSFLNNQRAAGHRGSVRKHNTAGRPSDDVKGILRLNVEGRSMRKHRFSAETPTNVQYQNYISHIQWFPDQCDIGFSSLKRHYISTDCFPFFFPLPDWESRVLGYWCHDGKIQLFRPSH